MLPSEWEKRLVDINVTSLSEADLEWQYILAVWRSIYQLGIRGVERAHYWRLFFWTRFRRPRLFPLAITFAIYGFHFRQVIDLHVG